MAETIEIHFKNSRGERAVLVATLPVAIRYTTPGGKKARSIVRPGKKAESIFLDGFDGPSTGGPAPGVDLQADDPSISSESLITSLSGGNDDSIQAGPGVCYEIGRQVFCW
jgi:hypothetical protein